MIPKIKQLVACCTALLLVICAAAQPKITRVEYYIDKDPGYGKATAVTITSATNLSNIALNIVPGSVSFGVHVLGIRALDASGHWGLDNKFMFARPYSADSTGPASTPQVTLVEYYFDKDPGYGKATAASITAGTNLSNVALNFNPSTLSYGLHVMGIRAKDAKGRWGLDNRWLFARPYAADSVGPKPTPRIKLVEYYIDKDPGYGKAISVAITPGTNLSNVALNIDPSTITNGVHVLGVRARDSLGKWSLDNRWIFSKPSAQETTGPGSTPKLKQIEYYIDKDPGYGKAVPVAFNTATSLTLSMPIDIAGLTAGGHKLLIRAKDSLGRWSLVNSFAFNVTSVVSGQAIVVNSITDKTLCYSDSFYIAYHANGTFNAANKFNVQLSSATGSFASPTVIGSFTGITNSIVKCKVPASIASGNAYRVRVVSTSPVVTGITGKDSITIGGKPAKAVSITGDSTANVNLYQPYKVPNVTNITWTWVATGGTISGTGDSVNVKWPSIGSKTLKVVQTNQYGCISDTTSKKVTVYNLSIDSIKLSKVSTCPGDSITVTAKVTGSFKSGNKFTAQLSSATGSFASPVAIGTLTSAPFGTLKLITIKTKLPSPLTAGTAYRIRVISSLPKDTSNAPSPAITVKSTCAASIPVIAIRSTNADADNTDKVMRSDTKDKVAPFKNMAPVLYPNPANNVTLLSFESAKAGNYTIELTDLSGRILSVKSFGATAGKNTQQIDVSKYASGMYLVNVLNENKERVTIKLVKQK